MHTHHSTLDSTGPAVVIPPATRALVQTPLTGIERLMAEALMALDRQPAGAMCDPGAIEYASWIRLLHRSTP